MLALPDLHLAHCLVSLRPTLISLGSEHLSQLLYNPVFLSLGTFPAPHFPTHPLVRFDCSLAGRESGATQGVR
jgi:hypothetical protein